MSWTTPRTWANPEVVGETEMNQHVRDNFNETAPAKATTAGELIVVTGANAIGEGHNNVHVMVEAMIYG